MPDTKIGKKHITGIWWNKSWSPVTGCSSISEGCANCWARRMAKRLAGRFGYPKDDPFRVTLHPERLDDPLRWKKPKKIFVVSMGDLFHADIPNRYIKAVRNVIRSCPQHTFLILTKRPQRYLDSEIKPRSILPNVWLGVSVENQQNERIPILLQIPAKVRFVSIEPMLGPVDLSPWIFEGHREAAGFGKSLHWVILGGETGPKARPMHPDWARNVRDQCQEAGVPFFFKQWGDCPYPPNTEISAWVDAGYDPYIRKDNRLLDGRIWEEFPRCGE